MRWFLDTEFNEDGRTIELISIALVSERGSYYYACSTEFDPDECSDWVKQNVLPHLPNRTSQHFFWRSRAQIADDLRFVLVGGSDRPEIWAYYADYDWVALCQLFGRMVDLPDGMPMFCRDLKQHMETFGITKDMLPKQRGTEHDALADARWVREAFLAVDRLRAERGSP